MQLLTPTEAAGRVTAALKSAAEATGAGFDYLLRTATRESSLNATAKNPSSSARGIFQFIDSTWLEVLKEEGPKLGMADAAADVTKTASGRYTVADPNRKAELLAMRDDPQASALLGAAFTRRNAQAFEQALGRAPTEGELYAAHFLGAQGAIELTTLAATSPNASAADEFPTQASANRTIFYAGGKARTAREVYDRLTATPALTSSGATLAAAAAQPATVAATQPASGFPAFPTTRVAARAAVQASSEAAVPAYNGGRENDGQAFHSLFKTGRRSPVASYVQQAWSGFGSAGLASDGSGAAAASAAMSYAGPQPTTIATPRAAAAVAAVEQAGRPRAAKPVAASAAIANAGRTAYAKQAASQPVKVASAATAAPTAAAHVAVDQPARRKIELTTFLGIQLPSWLAPAQASATRGRP